MSFIPVNMNEASEPQPVVNGRYDLTIANAELKLSKESQLPMFRCRINIDGHDDAPSILHHVMIPQTMEEVKSFKGTMFKRFASTFGVKIPAEGIDPEKMVLDLIGARATGVEVRQKEFDGNLSNELALDRLKDEASAAKGRGSPPKR